MEMILCCSCENSAMMRLKEGFEVRNVIYYRGYIYDLAASRNLNILYNLDKKEVRPWDSHMFREQCEGA